LICSRCWEYIRRRVWKQWLTGAFCYNFFLSIFFFFYLSDPASIREIKQSRKKKNNKVEKTVWSLAIKQLLYSCLSVMLLVAQTTMFLCLSLMPSHKTDWYICKFHWCNMWSDWWIKIENGVCVCVCVWYSLTFSCRLN